MQANNAMTAELTAELWTLQESRLYGPVHGPVGHLQFHA